MIRQPVISVSHSVQAKRLAPLLIALTSMTTGALGCGPIDQDGGSVDRPDDVPRVVAADCANFAGSYQLTLEGRRNEVAPWVLLREGEHGCEAVVASPGFPGRAYDVFLGSGNIELAPLGPVAHVRHHFRPESELTEWKRLYLDLAADGLTGAGTVETLVSNEHADVGPGFYEETLDVRMTAPDPTSLMPRTNVPWRPVTISATRPIETFAANLSVPSAQWSVQDVQTVAAVGTVEAEVSFHGNWDDVRGQSFVVGADPGLTDLAGLTTSTTEVLIEYRDVGPAVPSHDFHDTSTLALWGGAQAFINEDCAELGCIGIVGAHNEWAGIAGQLDTTGKTEVVLAMRDFADRSRASVVTENGTELVPVSGGEFERDDHEWVYDVSGHTRVGFTIEARSVDPSFYEPLVVTRVFAR